MNLERLAVGAALTATFAVGCSVEQQTAPPYDASETFATSSSTASESPPDYIEPNSPPCPIIESAGNKQEKSSAKACQEALTGRVALVGYNLDEKVLERLADDTEKVLDVATKGLVRITITPQQASEVASSALRQASPTCIDVTRNTTWGSFAAYQSDKELGANSYIAAASPKPACQETTKSASEPATNLVEVFDVENILPPFQPETENGQETATPSTRFTAAGNLARELLHAYGVHEAKLLINTNPNSQLYNQQNPKSPTRHLDALNHLKNGRFQVLNETSLTGIWDPDITKQLPSDKLLNPIQLAWLNAPNAVLKTADNPFVVPTERPVVVDKEHIYRVPLSESAQLSDLINKIDPLRSDSPHSEKETQYSLMLVPQVDNGPSAVKLMQLYLASESSRKTFFIDSLYGGNSWDIKIGKEDVVIKFAKSATTIKVA